MKKFFFGLAALMLSMTVLAERVSQEDAALVANNFMNVGNTVSGVQKAPAKKMVLKKAATASENQYYVYENANGEGWVMVAANDVVSPILAYSNTGTFRTDNQPVNVRSWLGKYDKFITKIEADGAAQDEEVAAEWSALKKGVRKAKGDAVVGPLVKTTWDQDNPYWTLTPNGSGSIGKAYTGCVATAMAQVMNYWQWPKKGTGSHTYQPIMQLDDDGDGYPDRDTIIYPGNLTANFGETTYDWDNMLNKYTSSATTAQKNAVATLMFHCGVSVEMMYGDANYGGSGTYTVNYGDEEDHACAQNALWMNFGYKKSTITGYMRDGFSYQGTTYYEKWTDAEWTAMVKEELDKKHPIMYGGASDEGGHSFICDGYDDSNYFHFNWGWSGSNDGYYKLSSLKPGSGGAGGGGYDFSEDQDVLIGIVPDKKDLPMITITWSVDGDETTSEIMQEDPLVLPANPANCENGKVFVGWTAQSEVSGEKPADLFTTAKGKTVTEAITYYAVFATAEGGSAPVNTTLTMEDYKAASGTFGNFTFEAVKNSGSTAPTYNADGKDVRLYAKNTLTISSATEMTEIVFNISTAGLKRLAPITASTGTIATQKSGDTQVTWTGSATSVTFTVGDKADYGTDGSSKAGQLDFTSVDITAGGGATYSDYSLSCGAAVVCELSSIELNTTNVKKTFKEGEAFNYNGLVVTAHFSNCADKTVTPTSVSTPDMSTPGNKTITVSYTKGEITKTATYDITVTELPTYAIKFFSEGTQVGATQNVKEGQQAEVPTGITAECEDYTFVGWWTAELLADNTEAKAWISDFTATKDQNYYAIFSKTEEGAGGAAAFDGTTGGTFKIYAQVGETKYYATGTVSSGKLESTTVEAEASEYTFEKVTDGFAIKISENTYLKYSGSSTNLGTQSTAYTWNIEAGTAGSWRVNATTGSNRALAFSSIGKFGGYSTGNIGKTVQDATYYDVEIGGGAPAATTYYSSVVTCGETAIDNNVVAPKAIKVLENGQIVIILGDQKYTIFGQKIQ